MRQQPFEGLLHKSLLGKAEIGRKKERKEGRKKGRKREQQGRKEGKRLLHFRYAIQKKVTHFIDYRGDNRTGKHSTQIDPTDGGDLVGLGLLK